MGNNTATIGTQLPISNPRGPTPDEVRQLQEWIESECHGSYLWNQPEGYGALSIAVFDDFRSFDYSGKVMYVINNRSVTWCDTFCWKDGRMEHIKGDMYDVDKLDDFDEDQVECYGKSETLVA